ncbi:adhesin [Bacillus atrophaeus]|uniref:adhesin n=1 Tax=Bacillus atrophaeus TaxID=1452 RepID=UPI001EFA7272|nr:adhesin [Bacillus atrophaeus]MCG8397496.1 adhesin [Bacillus atrophaeus]
MKITDNAKILLVDTLKQKQAEGIRFYFAGQGCCGPQLGLSLDSPETEDKISIVNGIQVAIDQRVIEMTRDLTLDRKGNQLALIGGSDSGCC